MIGKFDQESEAACFAYGIILDLLEHKTFDVRGRAILRRVLVRLVEKYTKSEGL